MALYLMQHGEAASKEVDPERPLTDLGIGEVTRVARAASAVGVVVSSIHHSGKLRALQTAELVAKELHSAEPPATLEGLAPNDDPTIVAGVLSSLESPAMLVGHLPHMSRLCSLLLTGDSELQPVKFRMGGIVRLSKDDAGIWRLVWMLTPEAIRSV
jgi:phosphohistidine phosphatase